VARSGDARDMSVPLVADVPLAARFHLVNHFIRLSSLFYD
jgi:hypothetical protein